MLSFISPFCIICFWELAWILCIAWIGLDGLYMVAAFPLRSSFTSHVEGLNKLGLTIYPGFSFADIFPLTARSMLSHAISFLVLKISCIFALFLFSQCWFSFVSTRCESP